MVTLFKNYHKVGKNNRIF